MFTVWDTRSCQLPDRATCPLRVYVLMNVCVDCLEPILHFQRSSIWRALGCPADQGLTNSEARDEFRGHPPLAATMESIMRGNTNYFSVRGRLNRLSYLFQILFVFIIIIVVYILASAVTYSINNSFMTWIIGVIIQFAVFMLLFTPNVKRFHDLGWSDWNILWLLIPIINILVSVVLIFVKGQSCDNRYGPDPLIDRGQIPD